jgi:hypothetical protein
MRTEEFRRVLREEVRRVLREAKQEEDLANALILAGEDVTIDDIELASKSSGTSSYDVTLDGEPYQFDVDNSGLVTFYDGSKTIELGYLSNPEVIASKYKKAKGI